MRLTASIVLLVGFANYAMSADYSTRGVSSPNILSFVATGNNVVTSTITMSTNVTGAAETWGQHEAVVYGGTNGAELPAGRWIDFYYNQTGAVTTAHGGGLFVRTHGNTGNQGFLFSVEGNTLCTSTYTSAACVSMIAHTKWDSLGTANIPAGPIIGNNSRIDVTSDSFGTTAYAQGEVIHYRADPFSIGGKPGLRYFALNDSDTDLQFVTAGNIIKLKVSSATVGGATLDVSKSCGGYLVLTSTGIIATGTQAFTTPSNNTTDGTYNDGCLVTVINGNLVGGRTITLKYNAANFLTTTGADIALGALGGSCMIASYPTAGVWIQTTPVTK